MNPNSTKKSDSISKRLCDQGDELLKQAKNLEALEKYTESLNYAETDVYKAMAYEKRSSVYLELEMLGHSAFDNIMIVEMISQSRDLTLLDRTMEFVEKIQQLRMILKSLGKEKYYKNDQASEILRHQGNKFFDQIQYQEALLKFNESICYAKSNLNLALGYANRSAVFLEMNCLPQCMKNIKLAREHDYPAEKMEKLDKRELKCLEKMTGNTKIETASEEEFFKLSYKANPKIPFIIEDLELRKNEKYGRYIITNRDLKPGDIICMETPFVSMVSTNTFDMRSGKILDNSKQFKLCAFCLNENHWDLIPCPTCNVTMYCNHDCMEKARRYHDSECPVIAFCNNSSAGYVLGNRIAQLALSIMNGSYEELEKLNQECLESPKSIFDFDFSDPNDPEFAKNQLRACLSMASDTNCVINDFSLQFDIANVPESARSFMEKFSTQLKKIVATTSSGIGADCDQFSLFVGLLNHSCNPNITRINANGQNCVIVNQHILKGGQIFDCCTPKFYEANKARRASEIKRFGHKWTICDCEACEDPEKFSLLQDLKTYDEKLLTLGVMLHKEIPAHLKLMITSDKLCQAIQHIKSKMENVYRAGNVPSKEYVMLSLALTATFENLYKRNYADGKYYK